MPCLFYGNFGFEHELTGHSITGGARRTAAELAAVWIALSEPGDLTWFGGAVDPGDFAEAEQLGLTPPAGVADEGTLRRIATAEPLELFDLCPWGWSESVVRWGEEHGLAVKASPLDIVRRANSRRFSWELEQRLGVALDGAALVTSLPELETALGGMTDQRRWVLKAEFSTAARERLLGRGPILSEAVAAWAQKRFRQDEVIAFEPWLDAIAEAGVQIDVPPAGDGEPKCLGVTPLLTGRDGAYQGSRFDCAATHEHDWSVAISAGLNVAAELQRVGYFGPLGIDAMLHRGNDGSIHCRPLQDINARWTMGRLALEFRRVLPPGECGSWLHVRWPVSAERWLVRLRERLPAGVRCVPTSPRHIGGEPVRHGTLLVLAPDDLTRRVAERLAMMN